jgi:hypothetical protein
MAQPGPYFDVVVETYLAPPTSGHRGGIRVRPIAGQQFPRTMNVECSKAVREAHPVGSRFRLRVKLTDREGGGEFLWSHHSWPFVLVSAPPAGGRAS